MIDYEFTVTDPVTWTRPWSGSLPLTRLRGTDVRVRLPRGQLRLENVLAGARAQERDGEGRSR